MYDVVRSTDSNFAEDTCTISAINMSSNPWVMPCHVICFVMTGSKLPGWFALQAKWTTSPTNTASRLWRTGHCGISRSNVRSSYEVRRAFSWPTCLRNSQNNKTRSAGEQLQVS